MLSASSWWQSAGPMATLSAGATMPSTRTTRRPGSTSTPTSISPPQPGAVAPRQKRSRCVQRFMREVVQPVLDERALALVRAPPGGGRPGGHRHRDQRVHHATDRRCLRRGRADRRGVGARRRWPLYRRRARRAVVSRGQDRARRAMAGDAGPPARRLRSRHRLQRLHQRPAPARVGDPPRGHQSRPRIWPPLRASAAGPS